MEIYKELNNPQYKEFEQLLDNQLSKVKIEEGEIYEGKVNKITDKYVFLYIPGIKSEPVLDINELKTLGLNDKIKLGEMIPVLLEKLEDSKTGEVIVSANKARKIKGWKKLVACYEKNEAVMGKITGKVKGGAIVEHIDTGTLMFLPGSQISSSPLKDISPLMNQVQKFAIIKLDRLRGNICCSRREIIDASKKESKAELIKKYPVGTIIKKAKVKNISSFGCFFSVNDELDVLVHTSELSYSRISGPDELFSVGQEVDLKVIEVNEEKQQVGCSVKKLLPDPFENIDKYEIGKDYKVKVVKLMDWGAFCELEPGLTTLLHSSELSWTKKNVSTKRMFKVNDIIDCRITEISKEKKRVAISHRLTLENPFEAFNKKYPVGSEFEGEVVNKNEYSLFVRPVDLDVDTFLHCNDLTYLNNGDEELLKFKKNDKIKVKVLEIKIDEQKIRVGHRQTKKDPFDFFKNLEINSVITCKIISTENKGGLIVRPENCEMNFPIKKSAIAISAADSRASRFTGGEKVDVAIAELSMEKRKVVLSMKLLEENLKAEVLEKYGSEGSSSGKNLPFASLSDDLKKKDKKKKEE